MIADASTISWWSGVRVLPYAPAVVRKTLSRRVLLFAAATAVAIALTATAAQAGSLGTAGVLATPTFTTPVAAAGGVVAWAAPSGRGHRFEVLIRRSGKTHALARTSAVGWIDGVKLGTDAQAHAIVVYSHCPHSPFATATAGRAGTDGCLLWWAPLAGGPARRVAAAPADTTVGLATRGKVVFAVQPNTGHRAQPARLETATLTGHTAHGLTVPTPRGAAIADVSVNAGDVAFIEAPLATNPRMGASQIWLERRGAAPTLVAQQASDTVPIDNSGVFFEGLTLTGSDVYAFLSAAGGAAPPAISQLEQIPLAGGTTATAPWTPGGSLSALGVGASAFDPSENRLVLGLFSQQVDFSLAAAACSGQASSAKACPVVASGPVSFS